MILARAPGWREDHRDLSLQGLLGLEEGGRPQLLPAPPAVPVLVFCSTIYVRVGRCRADHCTFEISLANTIGARWGAGRLGHQEQGGGDSEGPGPEAGLGS